MTLFMIHNFNRSRLNLAALRLQYNSIMHRVSTKSEIIIKSRPYLDSVAVI